MLLFHSPNVCGIFLGYYFWFYGGNVICYFMAKH